MSTPIQFLEVAEVTIEVTGLYAPIKCHIAMMAMMAVVIAMTAEGVASLEAVGPRLRTALCWT
jgi:hypothetical protein